jgi:hypothetical protein
MLPTTPMPLAPQAQRASKHSCGRPHFPVIGVAEFCDCPYFAPITNSLGARPWKTLRNFEFLRSRQLRFYEQFGFALGVTKC